MRFNTLRLLKMKLATCVLLVVMSGIASAYTVVLRSGERVEIPDQFTLTGTTLTYEIAPSINRTILLNTVDIAATERANNEAAGNLRRQIARAAASDEPLQIGTPKPASAASPKQSSGGTQAAQADKRQRSTLTNQEIEALRRRNQASSQAYERQRRELPPMSEEEMKRRADEQLSFMQELEAERAEQSDETENGFRAEAQSLRLELAELNAELNYYRARLAEATAPSSLTSLATPATTIAGIPPVAYPYSFGGIVVGSSPIFGGGVFGAPSFGLPFPRAPFGGVNRGDRRGTSFGVGVNIGGSVRGGVIVGGGYTRRDVRNQRARQGYPFFYGYPYGFGVPFIGYPPVSNDVMQIRERLRELEAARQRLLARRRVLEDEARRAGVAPGVLRP